MALQLCSATPQTLHGLRASVSDSSMLAGVHLLVTARDYGRPPNQPRIHTVPVHTHPDGIVEIVAESGMYRYMVVGEGRMHLRITKTSVTYVDVRRDAHVTIDVDTGYLSLLATRGTVTINSGADAAGVAVTGPGADVTITGAGEIRRVHDHTVIAATLRAAPPPALQSAVELGLALAAKWKKAWSS